MKKRIFFAILSAMISTTFAVAQTDSIVDFLNKGANQGVESQAQEYFRAIVNRDAEGIYKFMYPSYVAFFDSKNTALMAIKEEFKMLEKNDTKIISIKFKPGTNLSSEKIQKLAITVEVSQISNTKDSADFDGEIMAVLDENRWYFYHKTYFTNSLNVLALSFAVEEDDDEGWITYEAGVLNGRAISLPAPEYPKAAQAAGASGSVNVYVQVNKEGNVTSAKAESGHKLLRKAAEEAALKAKFKPYLVDGKAVDFMGTIAYIFSK